MRSMMTSESDGPGTSTPCHGDTVPNSNVDSSAANYSTSVVVVVSSP
jgi:hypothetical protein